VKPLRIVAVSDTHKYHWWLAEQRKDDPRVPILPSGDVLVHCGDILRTSCRQSDAESLTALIDFNDFLGAVKGRFKHGVLVIPGNHDTALEALGVDKVKSILTNCRYLVYEGVVLDGVSFFGCPISHGTSCNRGFQDVTFDPATHIPAFCDVLLTHGSVHHRPIQDILRSGVVSMSNGTVAPVLEDVGVVPYGMRCRLNIAGHDHNNYGACILQTLPRLSFETCQRVGLRPPVPAHMPLPQIVSMGSLEYWPSLEAQRDRYPSLFTGVPSQRDLRRESLWFETVCVVACTVSMTYRPTFYPVVMEIFPKPDATPESLLQEITPCRVSAPSPARPSRVATAVAAITKRVKGE